LLLTKATIYSLAFDPQDSQKRAEEPIFAPQFPQNFGLGLDTSTDLGGSMETPQQLQNLAEEFNDVPHEGQFRVEAFSG
jgi:hypothetical protein